MILRKYQSDMIEAINQAWNAGYQNVGVQLSTGGGKTVLFSNIIANNRGPSIAIAHRIEIVAQISLTLGRYGIRHNILAQKQSKRDIVNLHMQELGRRYYDPHAPVLVAGVDTLLRMDPNTPEFKAITLVVQDEGHHPLRENKWGKAAGLFPNARGLYPTATPCRADGRGLGRSSDGIIDTLIVGPTMRELMREGYLTDYRIFAPPSNLDLTSVDITASGDFSNPKLRAAVHKSRIMGDVIDHYIKIAGGKLGVTFAVDVEAANNISQAFNARGIKSEVITAKTPDLLRTSIMRKFRNREILQIVNVDLLGEGVDVPAIEVISMARPTASYSLYAQQFGRALRPMVGKDKAIIIDHVDNVKRHGLPDSPREWALDRQDRRSRKQNDKVIKIKSCLSCFAVFEAYIKCCPYCGHYNQPKGRGSMEEVEGDLLELDGEVLANLRGEIIRVDSPARINPSLSVPAQLHLDKSHRARQDAQKGLRGSIARWAGYYHPKLSDSEIYRLFYFTFGTDILTAQTLNTKNAKELQKAIDCIVNKM